ncbi:MAG: SIR2 family protein [Microscillaceae bacterium]|nr:SIR2 family protein [Microscillaceae bacterium]
MEFAKTYRILSFNSPANMNDETQQINFEQLKTAILREKAILFLGPELTVNFKDKNKQTNFFRDLAAKALHKVQFHEEDHFLIFQDEDDELLFSQEIETFYRQNFSNAVLEQLAEIPFHLIVSVSPDLSLKKVFENKKFAFQAHYYKKKIKGVVDLPSKEKPLLYQLLGSVEAVESLITSHSHLFAMLQSVYADKNLPENLVCFFDNSELTDNVIFLGFDFEKWYFQLILHLLKVRDLKRCLRYAAQQSQLSHSLQTLYEKHFKLNFINGQAANFVNKLYQCFQPEELRQVPTVLQVKKYLKNNLIKFLNKAYSTEELNTLCLCYFEDVYEQFAPEMAKLTRINSLVTYVEAHQAYEVLLEQGKEHNPVLYQQFAPYYE